MNTIRQQDFIQSIADALQFISYYHPIDYIQALGRAHELEQSPAARDAIAQILHNSRMCAEGHRPICQDTGIVVVFIEIGMELRWEAGSDQLDVDGMVNEGVRRAYLLPENVLRASMVSDPAGARRNTGDNTPAVVHSRLVPGDRLAVKIAAKGGGSENKARFVSLNPNDDLVGWIVDTVEGMGAGWCPPGLLGVGIGGNPEKSMLLAKESLLAPIDMQALIARGPASTTEELRIDLYERINALGIGAQGLGGQHTVLDVKVLDFPCHAASLPVALNPNCAATRHTHFELDGSGPALFTPPSLLDWPAVTWKASPQARKVDLDTLTHEQVKSWKPGERLLLNGHLLTGRDAAHKRIADLLEAGEPLPDGVNFTNRLIYYVGPVDPVGNEAVGPAGPTTATRMDKYTETMLGQTGLLGMVGKAERGPETIASIREHQAAYLIAVGGAAFLISQAIRAARVVAFADLGMEAIYEFEVMDMPVTVAVDSHGESVHQTGPREWRVAMPSRTVKKS